jgi:hypothetical protein
VSRLLDPEQRTLLTEALHPPAGYQFDAGIATTYSLDLDVLLATPLHLSLFARGQDTEALLADGVALLDAVRRTSERLLVFCQKGQVAAPSGPRVLFSLLEPVICEALAPGGSAFHPKLWLLRFTASEDGYEPPLYRLVVLTRNITADQSWDMALQIEGEPGETERRENGPLVDFLLGLPELAPTAAAHPLAEELPVIAAEVACVRWRLPEGFSHVRFHAPGADGRAWRPHRSDRLAVVSPFCIGAALDRLADSTTEPVLVLSRPEELDKIPDAMLGRFAHRLVLSDAAEADDGEDTAERAPTMGLHAKVYIAERGLNTHIYVGSANATTAALVAARNVELVAELIGRTERVGGVDTLLAPGGLRDLLTEYGRPEEPPAEDPARVAAEELLERVWRSLRDGGIVVTCARQTDTWSLHLRASGALPLHGAIAVHVWPVTLLRDRSRSALPFAEGAEVVFPDVALESLTSLFAFEIVAEVADLRRRFVLNLPIEGLPVEERDSAVIRQIVRNRESFLRYLLLLLGGLELEGSAGVGGTGFVGGRWGTGFDDLPLLEEMTRAFCREPHRLGWVRDLMRRLQNGENIGEIVPDEFRDLWATFERALEIAR